MSKLTDKANGRIKNEVGPMATDRGLEREGKKDKPKGPIEPTVEEAKPAAKRPAAVAKHAPGARAK